MFEMIGEMEKEKERERKKTSNQLSHELGEGVMRTKEGGSGFGWP